MYFAMKGYHNIRMQRAYEANSQYVACVILVNRSIMDISKLVNLFVNRIRVISPGVSAAATHELTYATLDVLCRVILMGLSTLYNG